MLGYLVSFIVHITGTFLIRRDSEVSKKSKGTLRDSY